MTGSGFSTSLDDPGAIAEAVAEGVHGSDLENALPGYEDERLSSVRTMVRSGQQFSRTFGRAS
jgi:2-polyprenyl-6-methoxyphenol hydroxylase-like FAD-dependent oxidoreductase